MNRNILWRGSIALLLIALTLIGMLVGFAWRRGHPAQDAPRLTVTFLAVGNGDCTLIQTPEGRAILLDAGSAQASAVVASALRRLNVKKIDLLILTSPAETSIGGVPALLDNGIGVTQVWDNPVADAGDARRNALEAIRQRHIPSSTANAGDTIQIGAMLFVSTLWPPDAGQAARRDPLVCRINYGSAAFLFEGAATSAAEQDLIGQSGSRIGCDGPCSDLVLQVAAHAEGSPTPELLRRATPAIAVISCGADDAPAQVTLHRLQAAGAAVWRTDTQGNITVMTNGRISPVVTAARLPN